MAADGAGAGDQSRTARDSIFNFSAGDRSLSTAWTRNTGHQNQWSGNGGSLFKRVGATDKINKSLAALNEVVTPSSHTPYTPGYLLKGSFRGDTETPRVLTPLPGTPVGLHGDTTNELFMTVGPDDTAIMGQTFLNTTLFGEQASSGLHTTSDDPVEKTSKNLVRMFHQCYMDNTDPSQSLELVATLQEACNDQIASVKSSSAVTLTPLISELSLESNTWELLRVLYSDRLEEAMDSPEMCGRSHREITDEFFTQDSDVRQAQLVVDWLEKSAVTELLKYPHKTDYMTDSVGWENTQHSLERGRLTQQLVSQMDPDAPRREGKHLAELDEKDEQTFLKHLFTCIRAGEVAKAQELCVTQGQAWRAATLEGWRLHHDPNYGKNVVMDEMEPVEGNATRDLWKLCTWQLSSDAQLNVYEKALYAGLSGNVKQILPACTSWLDCVWAYFKGAVDVLTERRLRASSPSTGLPQDPLPSDYWNAILAPELIFQEIEASPNAMVLKQSRNPFHVAQKFIILGSLDSLVTAMHSWLGDSPNLYLLRFMTHLTLFAQTLGQVDTEDERCSDIIQAYVKGLIKENFRTCVALYTVRLPRPLQISCYASLLEGIDDPDDQRECLELGSAAGLDVAVITKSVVEHMRNSGPDEEIEGFGPEWAPLKHTEITKLDKSKIEVIRWLIFDRGQRSEAIHQGNALMRQFLATRKLSAAEALFRKLPSDSVEVVKRVWASKAGDSPLPADMTNDIHEYCCIQSYLECHATFNEWFRHFHHNKPESPPEPSHVAAFTDSVAYEHKLRQYESDVQNWSNQLNSLSEDVEASVYGVIQCGDSGWMVDPQQGDEVDQRRAAQLVLLREICIPQVTLLLHTVFNSTGQTRKCLRLADIVASEQHQLYKVFRSHELERLLSLLQHTAITALGDRQNHLGYPA